MGSHARHEPILWLQPGSRRTRLRASRLPLVRLYRHGLQEWEPTAQRRPERRGFFDSRTQARRLELIGKWLSSNGEAIYETRPWLRAEGETTDGLAVRSLRPMPFASFRLRAADSMGLSEPRNEHVQPEAEQEEPAVSTCEPKRDTDEPERPDIFGKIRWPGVWAGP
jgi:hypothetical protein